MVESPSDIKYSQSGNRTPVVMAVLVAVIAAGISFWGVDSTGLMAGLPVSAISKPAPPAVVLPSDNAERERLLSVGAGIHQQSCAGCHSVDSKLIGPSYLEICRKYGESIEVKGSPAPGVTNQVDISAVSAISLATMHPVNSWDAYERGPDLTLTAEERRAVAFWIFNCSREKEGADD